ncbi:pyrroline-5-carboxylate reductase [Piscinibacter koreensis]|uniref:Pyrroline-5-carboxylate reductase n=1 Tax=Piscinibacter koreensis TaxID=2742824 RepID=A0A7Y6NJJ5_9BURK|nr:pyrroline-5-carboxylate reductase [Schlegelella koreensis]NUZ04327.1 pyrroline-5-carboxylate reductase [Schlegelella koreensis]
MDSIAFIGGGNMASALIGGLVERSEGHAPGIVVVDPDPGQRERLAARFGVRTLGAADASLAGAGLVVWAVKPQYFKAAAAPCASHVAAALHLSVMAGIRSEAIARALDNERVVRAMPNTPALIGRGIAGLYARPEVGADERARVEALLAPTGEVLWVDAEVQLDAVTALSGSGPAYVFYVAEAMADAATAMGLSAEQGRRLALATCAGAASLAQGSSEPLGRLREQVTSKGGTTAAALATLDAHGVRAAFGAALEAARRRAAELGDEFG